MGALSALSYVHTCSGCAAEAGGFWYSRSVTAGMFTHTRSGRGRICHFLRTMMVWSTRFRSGRGKLGVGPVSCRAVFAPAPPPFGDRACVNACNDLCWSQFSARPRPRMCERTFSGPSVCLVDSSHIHTRFHCTEGLDSPHKQRIRWWN